MRIAISPMSWGVTFGGNRFNISWRQFLDEVKAAGYDGIELGTWGYLPTALGQLQEALIDRGLSLAAAQLNADFKDGDSWSFVMERTAETCDLLNQMGCKRLVLLSTYARSQSDGHTASQHGDAGTWDRMIDRIQGVARRARASGVLAVYHPHAGGGIESEEQIERLLADTDPELVSLCFDTGHHAYSGGNVVAFIREHAGRIGHVHLKNVNGEILQRVLRDKIAFSAAARMGVMTELRLGQIDFTAVRDALWEIGFDQWSVVEQDLSQSPSDSPGAIAARNRQFLRELKFN